MKISIHVLVGALAIGLSFVSVGCSAATDDEAAGSASELKGGIPASDSDAGVQHGNKGGNGKGRGHHAKADAGPKSNNGHQGGDADGSVDEDTDTDTEEDTDTDEGSAGTGGMKGGKSADHKPAP